MTVNCPVKLTADIIGGKWKPLDSVLSRGQDSPIRRTSKADSRHDEEDADPASARAGGGTGSFTARSMPRSLPRWSIPSPGTERA